MSDLEDATQQPDGKTPEEGQDQGQTPEDGGQQGRTPEASQGANEEER